MGLDQSVYKTTKFDSDFLYDEINAIDFEDYFEEIAYWRKFWGLQHFMHELASKKGLKDYSNRFTGDNITLVRGFNCVAMKLDKTDIDILESEVDYLTNELCDSICEPEDERKDLIKFIKEARKTIDMGYNLYYYGNW